MQKVTAVSFVYNEEKSIGECLKQLAPHVDEVLLVDLESTDRTMEVAYQYTKNIFRVPHLICGDFYKQWLSFTARGDWLLWFYPDERFSELFLTGLNHFCESVEYDAYSIMRHEYRNGIRLMPHGTTESPNYQNRLHRKGKGIFYSELVHAELHGKYRHCQLPPEIYMEHRKENVDQEFDNIRLYIEMHHLIWKYRDTKLEPYKRYVESYRRIISESEAKNESGERMVHPSEELWFKWWEFREASRLPQWIWSTVLKGEKTVEQACAENLNA